MFSVKIKTSFAAAHQLKGYQGLCEELHGHNWKVEVEIQTAELNEIGLSLDFKELKGSTDEILNELDHKNLNQIDPFSTINPSSENIAMWLYKRLSKTSRIGPQLKKVTVYETDNFSASYFEPEN